MTQPQDGGPSMTLPNGDVIRKGEYGVTSDGQKVGPMKLDIGWPHMWRCASHCGAWEAFGVGVPSETTDIIAKWHPVEAGADPVTPNYNDGNWHGWNGGECPVHPESVVEVMFSDGGKSSYNDEAGNWCWGYQVNSTIIAFRVANPYAEPAPEPVKPASSPAVKVGDYVKSPDVVTVNLMLEPASAPYVAFDWGNEKEVARITKAAKEALKDMQKPAKRDLRTIDEPFGELDERTQKRLRKAAKRGWPVQMFYISAWCGLGNPAFQPDVAYRLDPTFTPPEKRATFWLTNGRVFQTAREAKTAYPGSDPVKARECKVKAKQVAGI